MSEFPQGQVVYCAKWGNINGSRGNMKLTLVGRPDHTIESVHVNQEDLLELCQVDDPAGEKHIRCRDGSGYTYQFHISQTGSHINATYSKGGHVFGGPGTPYGAFGIVYAQQAQHPNVSKTSAVPKEQADTVSGEKRVRCDDGNGNTYHIHSNQGEIHFNATYYGPYGTGGNVFGGPGTLASQGSLGILHAQQTQSMNVTDTSAFPKGQVVYRAKWGNITGSRGNLKLIVVGTHDHCVESVHVNDEQLQLLCQADDPCGHKHVRCHDGSGRTYQIHISQSGSHLNATYSRGGHVFGGPGTPDSQGAFGIVFAQV